MKSLSRVRLFETPWTAAQAPPSVGFPRREHWSGCPRLPSVRGISQARALEWGAIAFPPSVGFPRREHWSGCPRLPSVRGVSQARALEWVPSPSLSTEPRDRHIEVNQTDLVPEQRTLEPVGHVSRQLEACGNSALRKSIGALFATALFLN